MGDIDEMKGVPLPDEEDLFLNNVVCGEAELLFLDSYLRELFRNCE